MQWRKDNEEYQKEIEERGYSVRRRVELRMGRMVER
jgi:hypothetical protein